MTQKPLTQVVQIEFVGAPPTRAIRLAAGVRDVRVEGSSLRCVVVGSFQPFLEAVRGHEVIRLLSVEQK